MTNQRCVWVEVVVGLYESRQEAPLTTILSVGIQSDPIGRSFDFGDVIVRTFTGDIPLRHVNHPAQLASMVEEHWGRSKITSQKEDAAAMQQAIRARLDLPPGAVAPAEPKAKPQEAVKRPVKPGFFKTLFSNVFTVRFDAGDVVIYRKHWFVLLENTWIQIVLFAVIILILVARLVRWYTFIPAAVVVVLSGLSLLIVSLWWLYSYADWANDIYQVTPDQIVDIERKPLGTENKRTAPLENILSIEYERLGFLGILFNFGTVYIRIGSTTFPFNTVFDPSQVQQDIFRRKWEKELKRKKAEKGAERERLASWFATYHLNYGEQAPNSPLPSAGPVNDHNHPEAQPAEDETGDDEDDRNGLGWIG